MLKHFQTMHRSDSDYLAKQFFTRRQTVFYSLAR